MPSAMGVPGVVGAGTLNESMCARSSGVSPRGLDSLISMAVPPPKPVVTGAPGAW